MDKIHTVVLKKTIVDPYTIIKQKQSQLRNLTLFMGACACVCAAVGLALIVSGATVAGLVCIAGAVALLVCVSYLAMRHTNNFLNTGKIHATFDEINLFMTQYVDIRDHIDALKDSSYEVSDPKKALLTAKLEKVESAYQEWAITGVDFSLEISKLDMYKDIIKELTAKK